MYYKPGIEDLFVGYECEISPLHEDVYKKVTLCIFTDFNGKIRTPFLTKEQVVEEGWEIISDDPYYIQLQRYIGVYQYYEMLLDVKNHTMSINYIDDSPGIEYTMDECIYEGMCPSINEFRKIKKLLKLK